ncbi:MAG TPA: FHA domain-containing protein [Candidatus Binataceae bacterium]|nr:FHA domain-containing protein [Candidatus Binataceae bacterium]
MNSLLSPLFDGSLNRRELAFKALAGLTGGAIGWIPIEIVNNGHHLGEPLTTAQQVAGFIASALAAGMIGGLITAVEAAELRISPQTKSRFVRGFVLCAVLSLVATWLSNYAFNGILVAGGVAFNPSGELISGSIATIVFGRIVGWAIDGALLGAGVGLSTLVLENVVKGSIGGLAGGAVGGIFFDLIGSITGAGAQSRFFGEAAIGLAIGLLIGLVHELTKSAWVTIQQGRLKGRQYRIEGARATLGRAEENPVGLFGDPSVQMRHAVIERKGADYVIRNLAVQDGTFVNGRRIETVDLHDNDRIGIGGYELTFHLRQTSAAAREQVSLAADRPNPAHVATRLAGERAQAEGPCLIDADGRRYAIRAGAPTRLGRALDNDIVVAHSSVSRHHASIEAANGAFELKDLNSQNGTFVGSQRITQARISDGDAIRLGQAPFTFRA